MRKYSSLPTMHFFHLILSVSVVKIIRVYTSMIHTATNNLDVSSQGF